jgi:hypothetical protein
LIEEAALDRHHEVLSESALASSTRLRSPARLLVAAVPDDGRAPGRASVTAP